MKNITIENVYFGVQVHIRTRNETRPERMLSSARYKLELHGIGWLVVTSAEGHKTYVPAHNITSITESAEVDG